VLSAIGELDSRSGYEILDGAQDENLAWAGESRYACSCVDGEARDRGPEDLVFTGVETGPNLEP
jgi:hypothetical protein